MAVEHIEERNGGLYVKGKRVSLDSIVYAFKNGDSPQTIVQDFYTLSLADVYGAISHYLDNTSEVEAYLLRQQELSNKMREQAGPPHVDLKARARERSIKLSR
ncbi:MAG: DUF433 domain-containing protein [Acidobacteria bacterium]|nr:DUF433 domain-containing protein [Acidobacteriota bacterium]